MKNRLPQYWVVKRDKSNPNWKKVIDYLNQISGCYWEGDAYDYYGIEPNTGPGVNCYDTFSLFKGNPTLLTIEQFMELTNQNTMVDFKVKGTKLPVIPNGTYFRCAFTAYYEPDSQYIGNNYDLVSFGCKDFKGETYILADHKDYVGENYLMFKESILKELAKEQNLTKETMVTIKREQLQEIHDIACSTWKSKIKELAQDQPFGDIELSQTQVDEMFGAATSTQLPVLEKIFGKQEEPISHILSMIEIRKQGNLYKKSIFLPTQYTWEIVKDSDGVDCLVPTRKK